MRNSSQHFVYHSNYFLPVPLERELVPPLPMTSTQEPTLLKILASPIVAVYHRTPRIEPFNDTWSLVRVPSSAFQKALNPFYGSGIVLLAGVPLTDKSLFPLGFPANAHWVLVSAGRETIAECLLFR